MSRSSTLLSASLAAVLSSLAVSPAFANECAIDAKYVGENRANNKVWGALKQENGKWSGCGHCFDAENPTIDNCKPVRGLAKFKSCVVTYLGAKDRLDYQVTYNPSSQLFLRRGKPFDTGGHRGIYVVDAADFKKVYVNLKPVVGQFHHSSFLACKPVLVAGEVEFKTGRLVFVNNKSGHYKPAAKALAKWLRQLAISKYKVDSQDVEGKAVEPYVPFVKPTLERVKSPPSIYPETVVPVQTAPTPSRQPSLKRQGSGTKSVYPEVTGDLSK